MLEFALSTNAEIQPRLRKVASGIQLRRDAMRYSATLIGTASHFASVSLAQAGGQFYLCSR